MMLIPARIHPFPQLRPISRHRPRHPVRLHLSRRLIHLFRSQRTIRLRRPRRPIRRGLPGLPSLLGLLVLVSCSGRPQPWTLIVDGNREMRREELRLAAGYAADLQGYLRNHAGADDAAAARVELIRTLGELGDVGGAERIWRELRTGHPDDPLLPAAGLEMAEAALRNADADAAARAVRGTLTGAYGYANEVRLVQNLATLLAMRGRLAEAREVYDLVRGMSVYLEYPARFNSLDIFLEYLDRVGEEFPPLVGTAFGGEALDTRSYRGRPLFIHFWRRLGSLNLDMAFLEALQQDYPDLAVVSVNVGDEPEAVRQAVLKHAPRWPFWHDADGSYADSLGITFMGLYVHDPKGILLDREGRIAVMPGREGAIALGLAALEGPPAGVAAEPQRPSAPAADADARGIDGSGAGAREADIRGADPDGTVMRGADTRGLKEAYTRNLIEVRDSSADRLLTALARVLENDPGSAAGSRACLEILKTAALTGDVAAAERAWGVWSEAGAGGVAPGTGGAGVARSGAGAPADGEPYERAVTFALAQAMLTCGDPERSRELVYRAIGSRREREDLYLLCDLAAALSVLGDVDGARQAFEKIIEITGGAGASAWQGYIEALDRVGRELDHFTAEGLDGGTVASRDYAGQFLLIDFWGSWCHACIREMPHVYEAWNRYHDRGFAVLGIVVRDTREKARAFLQWTGYPWDQAFDGDYSIAPQHVVVGYPTTILVDRQGRVRCTRTFGGGLEIALRLLLER